jgi:hypothetical protein
LNEWPDATGAKKAHYIGCLRLGIAVAYVASIILTVEGYVCAQRMMPRNPKTAYHAG